MLILVEFRQGRMRRRWWRKEGKDEEEEEEISTILYLLCVVVEGKCSSALLCRLLSPPSELQWFYLVNHRPHAGQALPRDLLEISPICEFSFSGVEHSQISCRALLATWDWGWRQEDGGWS